MKVHVLDKSGKALMPTKRFGKVRRMLKQKKAKVVQRKPFTIQLLFETTTHTQDLTLGIDSGYKYIGVSVVSEKEELLSAELELLDGVKKRLKERSDYRKQRRSRKRHREPRFDNRITSKKKGWFAPTVQHKLDTHIRFIDMLKGILPISKTIIEVANFDIQKIKNPEITGKQYQEGEMMGFWNLREYILHRDKHTCQNPDCKNNEAHPILEIHHIVFRDNEGTDAPSNLITLCNKCHTSANHKKGKYLYEWQTKKPKLNKFRDATFMSTVRFRLVNLKDVTHTYGYITKNNRIRLGIKKTHYNDAFVIAGGTEHKRVKPIFFKQSRSNNRSLQKFYDAKYIDLRTGKKVAAAELHCGRTRRSKNTNGENLKGFRGQKISKGRKTIRKQRYFYQPNDLVYFEGNLCKVIGTMNKGKSVKLDNKKNPDPKKLKPCKYGKGIVAI
ncbi:RNA-guided endonuclease IscB [Virgibacillus profundi]|uniref:RNA-guided endonuclease IscB n=1 Tax=Virgibacillus profundi TaxID=2024555 RepID=UPI00197FD59B|nr:RNA-guided endonuclease IscB [Virgibacillus profundi]